MHYKTLSPSDFARLANDGNRDIVSYGRELFAHSEQYLAALLSAYATVVGEIPEAKREGIARKMLGWNMKPKTQCEIWNETMRIMQATD